MIIGCTYANKQFKHPKTKKKKKTKNRLNNTLTAIKKYYKT